MYRPSSYSSPFSKSHSIHSGYSIQISGGIPKDNRYVTMRHGQTYSIIMSNKKSSKCQASLSIDGVHMGNYLLRSYQTITVERPVERSKLFTFYNVNTSSSHSAGITSGNSNNGLIEVTFTPEMKYVYRQNSDADDFCGTLYNESPKSHTEQSMSFGCSASNYSEGGTGLSGHSGQEFMDARPLDLNYNNQVTLSVRLVGRTNHGYIYRDIEPLSSATYRQSPPPPVRKWGGGDNYDHWDGHEDCF